MKVGITGHQERKGIDWSWVKETVYAKLREIKDVEQVLSSLAIGSDQVFAEAAISLQIPVVAVIPLEGYERFFKEPALSKFQELLSQCEIMQLSWAGDPEQAFFEAGKFIVNSCDLLFAVWDSEKAEGLGGTGDIVGYAQQQRRSVLHINPLNQNVYYLQC